MPIFDFKAAFEKDLAAHPPSYEVVGIITQESIVYPLGSDTKVLSTIFESITRPSIYRIASANGYDVEEAEVQNCYPDFTLIHPKDERRKVAVDVKTTYRTNANDRVSFTLGGYTSFLRNETKSILYSYSHYESHWIIGYIYERSNAEAAPDHTYPLENIERVPRPYRNVDVFVQEKWRIAGEIAGSGNTTNIGSMRGTIDDFRAGKTVFKDYDEFLDYWRNYGKTAAEREGTFSNVAGYRTWRAANPP